MPRNTTTGLFTRVTNSFSQPVLGTIIDPSDADATFDDWDSGLSKLAPANSAAVDPTVAADSAAGYLRGSIWVNTAPTSATGRLFINTVNTAGAAVWRGLASYDTANNNLSFGTGTGGSLTSGANNIMFGNLAGRVITSGSDNILAGLNAGLAITTGTQNICIGSGAGSAITTDQGHVYIGYLAGTASNQNSGGTGPWNTGVGHLSMNRMTTGGSNAGFGRGSMLAETIGAFNSAFGHASLLSGLNNLSCIGVGNSAGGGSQTPGTDPTIGFSGDTNCYAFGTTAGKSSTAARSNCMVFGLNAALGAKDNHVVIGKGMTAALVSGRVVDSGSDRSLEATAAGVTLTAAQIYSGYTLRSGPGGNWNDTTPTAAQILAAFTGPGNATVTLENVAGWWHCRNSTAFIQTLLAGAGVATSGTNTTASGVTGDWLVKFSNTNAGAEACTFFRTDA